MKNLLLISIFCLLLSGCDDDDKDPFIGHWQYTPSASVNLKTDTLTLSFGIRTSGNSYIAVDTEMGGLKSWAYDFTDVTAGHRIGKMTFNNESHATPTTKIYLSFYNSVPSSKSIFSDSVVVTYGTTKSVYKNQVLITSKEK